MLPPLDLAAIAVGKAVHAMARRRGSGGSSLPGLIVERLRPSLLDRLVARLHDGTVIVTGTNGKTTTTRLVVGMLATPERRVLSNQAGSNMTRGVLSTLVQHASWRGDLPYELGVFEVDEGYVPELSARLRPRVLCVLNLHRDQLDRYGELDRTAQLIGRGVAAAATSVLNADDPLVAALADEAGGEVRFFGVGEDLRRQLPTDEQRYVLDEDGVGVGGGRGSGGARSASSPAGCPARRPDLVLAGYQSDGTASRVTLADRQGCAFDGELRVPGVFNGLNATAAVLTASVLGVAPPDALAAAGGVGPAFGRSEVLSVDGRRLQLFLVKNPAGLDHIVTGFLESRAEERALMLLNDLVADGRDVSWIWDARLDQLAGRTTAIDVGGIRAADLAVRLRYADVPIGDVEADIGAALDRFVASLAAGERGSVVATYTAMRAARHHLEPRAGVAPEWDA